MAMLNKGGSPLTTNQSEKAIGLVMIRSQTVGIPQNVAGDNKNGA